MLVVVAVEVAVVRERAVAVARAVVRVMVIAVTVAVVLMMAEVVMAAVAAAVILYELVCLHGSVWARIDDGSSSTSILYIDSSTGCWILHGRHLC